MEASLLKHLAIPVALVLTYSCKKGSGHKEAAQASATVQSPNACVVTQIAKGIYKPCTDAEVAEHQGKSDGFHCWYEACKIPAEPPFECEFGFKPEILSTAPERAECMFQNPVDL